MQRFSAHYSDIDDFAAATGWDLDFRQLDRGILHAELVALACPGMVAFDVYFDRTLKQAGAPPPGFVAFGVLDPETQLHRWCGVESNADGLLCFSSRQGFEGVSMAGHRALAFALHRQLLSEVAEQLCVDVPACLERGLAPFYPNPVAARRLRGLLRDHSGLALREHGDSLEQAVARQVLMALGAQSRVVDVPGRKRRHLLRSAVTMMEQQCADDISIGELCIQLKTSWSTLNRAFRDELQVTPQQYLQLVRLQRVRRTLREDDGVTRVYEAANRWGFWHMGQFTRDYKRTFGELPSMTLGRGKGRVTMPLWPSSFEVEVDQGVVVSK